MSLWHWLLIVLAVAVAWLLFASLPSLVRYFKIRRM